MAFLNSDALLEFLVAEKILTPAQGKFVVSNRTRQRQKLQRQSNAAQENDTSRDKNSVDLVDVIVSFELPFADDENRIVDDEMIMSAVSRRFRIPFKKLDPLSLDMNIVTKTIPKSFALTHLLVPLALKDGVLDIAFYDPEKLHVLQDVERAVQVRTRPFLSTKNDIRKILSEFFGFQRSISAAESEFGGPEGAAIDIGNLEQYVRLSSTRELSSSDQHIKAAVSYLFTYALDQRASDIHIEPKRDVCMVRFRIDGVLHTIYRLPKAVHSAIISRIKTLARMDIAEKRRPQDGRIKIGRTTGEAEAEVRVSTIPVAFGEKVVMRILDPEMMFQDLDTLGFAGRDRTVFDSFMAAPHGIVLVTGPTGSGKSTTLYSALKKIATPEKNIITIEDPVEMVYEDFNQIAVQPQIDVTFSSILRNILRQDPDVIMVGEMRDLETASHAVQAALTGHLVFSTLHTNDAVSSIIRLEDLGLEPFLIASTLLGVLAQRLVRRICPHCVETYTESAASLNKMGFPTQGRDQVTLKRGKGCPQCRNTGYLGRMGIFEIFPMSEQLKKLISTRAPESEIRQVAIREGMATLREDAWRKVVAGATTVEEALRVTAESDVV